MAFVIGILVVLGLGILVYLLCMSPMLQVFGRYPWHAVTREKVVALTFDDGPNEPYTSQLADFFAKEHVKATFFEVGDCIQRFPEVTKRLYREGHVIGNHSVHHTFSDYLKHPGYEREIVQNQQIIYDCIGKLPALFRSPWLWRQPWLLHNVRKHSLLPIAGRFCHGLEVFQPAAERIATRTLKKVQPGTIIIFHDGFDNRGGDRRQTVQAVQLIVPKLKEQGYKFVTVSELLGVDAYQ